MCRLRIKDTECTYKENDRRLKEQLINGINNQVMTAKIIKELTANKSEEVSLGGRMEAQ